MAGRAERYVHGLFQPLLDRGWWLKKNTDWSRVLGSKEAGVDYFLAMAGVQIEVKNTDVHGRLTDRPTATQARLLDEFGGFIFLVMWDAGYPRLPDGADAYLVPWEAYKKFLADTDVKGKSVRRRRTAHAFGADEYLAEYRLAWEKGHWCILPDCPFHAHARGIDIFWSEIISRCERLQMQLDSIKSWMMT